MINKINSLSETGKSDEIAVIINCGTKWFTSLAIASLLKNTQMPLLIIDCESTDGSEDHIFTLLSGTSRCVYWLSLPLRPHGMTLDLIFREIPARQVLLVDSDIEIRDLNIITRMQEELKNDAAAYGSGLLQNGNWMLPPDHFFPPFTAYYNERMWIPLVLLKTQPIRRALNLGESFLATRFYREIKRWPRLSKLLSYRFRIPILDKIRRGYSAFNQEHPAAVSVINEFDTGSQLHLFLCDYGSRLAAIPDEFWGSVEHFHGVTRARISSRVYKAAIRLGMVSDRQYAELSKLENVALQRLKSGYPEYAVIVETLRSTRP